MGDIAFVIAANPHVLIYEVAYQISFCFIYIHNHSLHNIFPSLFVL